MNVLKAAFAVFIVVGANARKPSEGPFQQQTSPSHSTVNQTRSRNLSCEPAPIAAKVKVKSTTGSPLQMREVRVFSSDVNVAIGKNATQSLDLTGISTASKAVDGRWGAYASTGPDSCTWWEVELGQSFPIEKVILVNRKCPDDPACACQLSFASVSLLDGSGDWVTATINGDTCDRGWIVHKFVKNQCMYTDPSVSPSSSPTTTSPTASATNSPNLNPTTSPSVSPTARPSNLPSLSPSVSPSTSPSTTSPTASPTNSPSLNPSVFPSVSPTTASPLKSPSLSPSVSPSTSPTTTSPTASPTNSPSLSPSTSPSVSSTASPSNLPSLSPSVTTSPTASPTNLHLSSLRQVQTVKLERTDVKVNLMLGEVEVYDESNVNQAIGKSAGQKSTENKRDASLAIDGDINSYTRTYFHNAGPWWQVDLQSEISFSKLIIYNRQDCCQGDLSWFTVYLFDGSGTPVGTYQLGNTEGMLKIEIAVSSFSLPTASPSNLPSLSASPSVSPTANPSNLPSLSPSDSPSTSPTTTLPTVSPTNSPSLNPSMTYSASPTAYIYFPNGVHADGSWQHPNGSLLGKYFEFDIAEWMTYFGSFSSGQVLLIKQCRGNETIYTCHVKVWTGLDSNNHNGRREPLASSSGGDWQSDDYVVKPGEDCIILRPIEPV